MIVMMRVESIPYKWFVMTERVEQLFTNVTNVYKRYKLMFTNVYKRYKLMFTNVYKCLQMLSYFPDRLSFRLIWYKFSRVIK